MARDEKKIGNKKFRFAAILSLTTHLFFVASVEGAVFLNKIFSLNTPEPFFYFRMASSGQDSQTPSEEKWNGKIEIPFPIMREKTPPAKKAVDVPLPKSNLIEKTTDLPPVDRAPFSESQRQIDKKVEKIRKYLSTRDEKPIQTPVRESLIPYVSDLEKVPSEARRELLPGYLKKMRRQIASVWLLMVQAEEVNPGSVTVRYRIRSDGSIFDLQALSFEASESFQEACFSAIREASPFDPLPFIFSTWQKDPYLTIELTFFLERSKKKSAIR